MFDDFADFFVEFFVGVVKFAIDSVVKFAINLVIFLVRHVLVSDVRHTLHRVRKLFIFPYAGKRRHRRAQCGRFVRLNFLHFATEQVGGNLAHFFRIRAAARHHNAFNIVARAFFH